MRERVERERMGEWTKGKIEEKEKKPWRGMRERVERERGIGKERSGKQ